MRTVKNVLSPFKGFHNVGAHRDDNGGKQNHLDYLSEKQITKR